MESAPACSENAASRQKSYPCRGKRRKARGLRRPWPRRDRGNRRASRSIEAIPARIGGDQLGLGSWVFSAVQRPQTVDGAVDLAVPFVLDERARVRQLAAGAAMGALPFPPLRDGQNGRKRPLDLGTPGVSLVVRHIWKSRKVSCSYGAPLYVFGGFESRTNAGQGRRVRRPHSRSSTGGRDAVKEPGFNGRCRLQGQPGSPGL
jgi:hypothetical protein